MSLLFEDWYADQPAAGGLQCTFRTDCFLRRTAGRLSGVNRRKCLEPFSRNKAFLPGTESVRWLLS
ncbi:MAG: hypothetical protein JWR21_3464 [Herminiimonas sp.]|nr:hypothetical protein [Herminiimonas sp.]MDB5854081.1 hypothetical protein [Herminiimonas sp.]